MSFTCFELHSIDYVAENVGVSRIYHEAGAYFDNVTQKLQIPEPPKNKVQTVKVVYNYAPVPYFMLIQLQFLAYSFH